MILTLRTDRPDAEIGLFNLDGTQLAYHTWHADRQLVKELLAAIRDQLKVTQADWQDVSGVVVFQGPGSFTGLRVGITVANSIAYANQVPIIATQGKEWRESGIRRIKNSENDQLALPHYGGEAHITLPRK